MAFDGALLRDRGALRLKWTRLVLRLLQPWAMAEWADVEQDRVHPGGTV